MQTTIEWTVTVLEDSTRLPGFTFNGWQGCMKVSPGCKFCYAEKLSSRWRGEKPSLWGPAAGRQVASDKYWDEPLKWNALAKQLGVRLKVFAFSMADVMEDRRDLDIPRHRFFKLIENTPNLNWLVLTKRNDFVKLLPEEWMIVVHDKDTSEYGGPADYTGLNIPRNLWMGMSIVDNDEILTKYPLFQSSFQNLGFAKVFISMEPLLGPMPDIIRFFDEKIQWPDWIIVGGESGSNARPMNPNWVHGIRMACERFGVDFFFKQWGEWGQIDYHNLKGHIGNTNGFFARDEISFSLVGKSKFLPRDVGNDISDKRQEMTKVGKHKSGRLLGNREYNNSPDYMKQTGNKDEIVKYLEKINKKSDKTAKKP